MVRRGRSSASSVSIASARRGRSSGRSTSPMGGQFAEPQAGAAGGLGGGLPNCSGAPRNARKQTAKGGFRQAFHRYGHKDVTTVLGGSDDGVPIVQFRKRCFHQRGGQQGSVRTDDDEAAHAVPPGVPSRAGESFTEIAGPLGNHSPGRGNVQRAGRRIPVTAHFQGQGLRPVESAIVRAEDPSETLQKVFGSSPVGGPPPGPG